MQPSSPVFTFPVGAILVFVLNDLPYGWLWCDGSEIGAEYELSKYIKNTPDLRGRFPRGTKANKYSGASGGADSAKITLAAENIPPHSHKLPKGDAHFDQSSDPWYNTVWGDFPNPPKEEALTTKTTIFGGNADGNAEPFEVPTTPPFVDVNYIIYAGPYSE